MTTEKQNSAVLSSFSSLNITDFIHIRTFLIFRVRRIGFAIFNFENPTSDLESATSKKFIL